jgi:hypothetical protein
MINSPLYIPCECGNNCGKMVYQNPKSTIKNRIHQNCQFKANFDKKKASKSNDTFFTGKRSKPIKTRLERKIDDQLDDAWSLLVKLRAGMKCEKCGKTTNLNSHHCYSRSNKSARWYLPNGICLDAGCHALNNNSAHKDSFYFVEWIKRKRGELWYNNLTLKAHSTGKFTKFEKELMLKELQNKIKGYGN